MQPTTSKQRKGETIESYKTIQYMENAHDTNQTSAYMTHCEEAAYG